MSKQTLRVGMIGVGGIAQGHIERFLNVPGVEIAALADPSESNIGKTLEKRSTIAPTTYNDYRALIEHAHVDAVTICTPHTQHFAQAIDCLSAGLHVLLEKPMVCRVDDAQALIQKVDETKLVLGLAYQRHAQSDFRYIHDRIASGEAGAVQFVTALQQQDWKRLTVGSWRQDPVLSGGGQVNDSGSHLVDVLLWATGLTPQSVSAFMDNKGTPVDIATALTVRFEGGALGTLNINGDAPGWYEDVTIWCQNEAYYVRNGQPLRVQKSDGTFTTPTAAEMPAGSNVNVNFVHAIQGMEPIAAPPICGLRTIQLTEAAWRSAAAGGALTKVGW